MAPPPNYKGSVYSTKAKQRKTHNTCCVPHCTTKCTEKLSYHSFPKDKALNKVWKIKSRIVVKDTRNLKVCGIHFLKIDFVGNVDGKRKFLNKRAVPSQNLPISSHQQMTNTLQNNLRSERALARAASKSIMVQPKNEFIKPEIQPCELQPDFITGH